jgi:hypothetical protein
MLRPEYQASKGLEFYASRRAEVPAAHRRQCRLQKNRVVEDHGQNFTGVPDEEKHKIVCGNAMDFGRLG